MAETVVLPAGCPPDGHIEPQGTFYRLAAPRHQPGDPTEDDSWVPPLHTRTSELYESKDACEAFAFSLFDNLQVLLDARDHTPWARRKSIARVDLAPGMGGLVPSESDVGQGHYDWWPEPPDFVPVAETVEARPS